MEMLRFVKIFIAMLCFIYNVNIASAQKFTQSSSVEKSFLANGNTTLSVINKYGKVQVSVWENDSVQVLVNVWVESKDPKKLNSLISNIKFDFNQNQYNITARTIFASENNLFSDIVKISDILVSNESQIKVDYTIYAPAYVNVNINNKFGDVYIGNLTGTLQLSVSNGNVKVEDIKGNSDIRLDFCKRAVIKSLSTAQLQVNYSGVQISSVQQLNLISKSSEIDIASGSVLKVSSKRDKFTVGNVNYFYGDTYFSDFMVENLVNELSMELKYGQIELKSVDKAFSLLNMNGKLTDITLYLKKASAYQIEIRESRAFLDLPYKTGMLQQKQLPENQTLLFGDYGSGNSKSKLSVIMEGGSLRISTE